jgi:hypothetical protein
MMSEAMGKRVRMAGVCGVLAAGLVALAGPAMAAGPEKYLHVNVQDEDKSESVNVNVPLSMAAKVLPAIDGHGLHDGKVQIHNTEMNGVDVRAVLDALRTAPDNEFVTVKDKDSDVRVAKEKGNIIVHVIDKKEKQQTVDVTVPMKVLDALVANAKSDELDIAGALQVLSDAGDVVLVTVHDSTEKVRIWVDSRNTQD